MFREMRAFHTGSSQLESPKYLHGKPKRLNQIVSIKAKPFIFKSFKADYIKISGQGLDPLSFAT
jgi:hypothetical protein